MVLDYTSKMALEIPYKEKYPVWSMKLHLLCFYFLNSIRAVIRFSLLFSIRFFFWHTNDANNTPIGSISPFGAETGGSIFGAPHGKGQFRNFGTSVWLIIKEERKIMKWEWLIMKEERKIMKWELLPICRFAINIYTLCNMCCTLFHFL